MTSIPYKHVYMYMYNMSYMYMYIIDNNIILYIYELTPSMPILIHINLIDISISYFLF